MSKQPFWRRIILCQHCPSDIKRLHRLINVFEHDGSCYIRAEVWIPSMDNHEYREAEPGLRVELYLWEEFKNMGFERDTKYEVEFARAESQIKELQFPSNGWFSGFWQLICCSV